MHTTMSLFSLLGDAKEKIITLEAFIFKFKLSFSLSLSLTYFIYHKLYI